MSVNFNCWSYSYCNTGTSNVQAVTPKIRFRQTTTSINWGLFWLCKKIDTCFMHQVFLKSTSGSCPPLFTLVTLILFLDTIKKHWTCEEFLIKKISVYILGQVISNEKHLSLRPRQVTCGSERHTLQVVEFMLLYIAGIVIAFWMYC